jgi:GAF domain-containing protein
MIPPNADAKVERSTAISPENVELAAELDQIRLASDTLYGIIRLVASSPDLERVLEGLVGVLTKATRCHACFVYLRRGDRLRLRAASELYAQLVGQIEFGVDEGLAGWVVRRSRPAFIRENAMEDPRTNHVPQLEEERFQSMVAVPVPARGGPPIGVIVLHTIAPREFDDGTLGLLSHAAPLLAGAIENAQLYDDARRRVAALTALSALSQRIAAVRGREELYRTATEGVRSLLAIDAVRFYQIDVGTRQLELVAADPQPNDLTQVPPVSSSGILLELVRQRGRPDSAANEQLQNAFSLDCSTGKVVAVPVAAGDEHLGVLVGISGIRAVSDEAEELLRAVANQFAVALKQTELIERLTEENIVRELFAALDGGSASDAETRARQARWDMERSHVIVTVQRSRAPAKMPSWDRVSETVEGTLRRLAPGVLCDTSGRQLRALVPLGSGGSALELRAFDEALARLGDSEAVSIGRSEVHSGADAAIEALQEAVDAVKVAWALHEDGGAMSYGELGAYRYLVHLGARESRRDPYLDAVRRIAGYDIRRGSQLLLTLEQYLADRRSATKTARALIVHRNTLRQRLDRIEALSGLDLDDVDLLALELAVKLARLQPEGLARGLRLMTDGGGG